MPLFSAKENIIYKNRVFTPGDIMNLAIKDASCLLSTKQIDYLTEEEIECHTAQSMT